MAETDTAGTSPSESSARPKRARRRIRFSLRSMMTSVLLGGLACCWLAVKMRAAERQAELVEMIRQSGGAVYYNFQYDYEKRRRINSPPKMPVWLLDWLGPDLFSDVVGVTMKNVSNQEIRTLQELHHLEALRIDNDDWKKCERSLLVNLTSGATAEHGPIWALETVLSEIRRTGTLTWSDYYIVVKIRHDIAEEKWRVEIDTDVPFAFVDDHLIADVKPNGTVIWIESPRALVRHEASLPQSPH